MSEAEVLTSEDLRNRLFDTLKKKGLVDTLKVRRIVNYYFFKGKSKLFAYRLHLTLMYIIFEWYKINQIM